MKIILLGLLFVTAICVVMSGKLNRIRSSRSEEHRSRKAIALKNKIPSSNEEEEEKAPKKVRNRGYDDELPDINTGGRYRNALTSEADTWYNPNNVGSTQYIYYRLSSSVSSSVQTALESAMRALEDYAATNGVNCVQFVHDVSSTQAEYFTVTYDTNVGCSANVGKTGARTLTITGSCKSEEGMLIHELLHILGLGHEHIRPDRDTYITLNNDNIRAGTEQNFHPYNWMERVFGTNYDFCSIMHYSPYAFAIDPNNKTISTQYVVPLCPGNQTMGQRVSPTDTDIYKIQRLYQCNVSKTPCPPPVLSPIVEYCSFESQSYWPWDKCGFTPSGTATFAYGTTSSVANDQPDYEMTFLGYTSYGSFFMANVPNSSDGSTGYYSSSLLPAGDYCIQFEFLMHSTASLLKVYTVLEDGVTPGVTEGVTFDPNAECYSNSGSLNNLEWLPMDYCDMAIQDISETSNFRVVFEVNINKTSYASVILDEIIIRIKQPDEVCAWDWLTDNDLNSICPGSVQITEDLCLGCPEYPLDCTLECLDAIKAQC